MMPEDDGDGPAFPWRDGEHERQAQLFGLQADGRMGDATLYVCSGRPSWAYWRYDDPQDGPTVQATRADSPGRAALVAIHGMGYNWPLYDDGAPRSLWPGPKSFGPRPSSAGFAEVMTATSTPWSPAVREAQESAALAAFLCGPPVLPRPLWLLAKDVAWIRAGAHDHGFTPVGGASAGAIYLRPSGSGWVRPPALPIWLPERQPVLVTLHRCMGAGEALETDNILVHVDVAQAALALPDGPLARAAQAGRLYSPGPVLPDGVHNGLIHWPGR